jgi:hypothetical protein
MSSDITASLRMVNGHLRVGLARLQPELNAASPLKPRDLSDLLAEVLRAAACRRGVAPSCVPDADWEKEISEYRSNLEKLRKVLPSVQGRLLAERARLQNAQSHVTAVKAWARASRATL